MMLPNRKKYHPSVPEWLHDRPSKMISHCMQRLTESENVKVIEKLENKCYHVAGSSGLTYIVSLATATCTCRDSCLNMFPCKHVFSAMSYDGVCFGDLKPYCNNPWFVVDSESAYCRPNPAISVDATLTREEENSQTTISNRPTGCNINPKSDMKASLKDNNLRLECRDLLKQLTNLTYELDGESIKSLHQALTTVTRQSHPNHLAPTSKEAKGHRTQLSTQPRSSKLLRAKRKTLTMKAKARAFLNTKVYSKRKQNSAVGIDTQSCMIISSTHSRVKAQIKSNQGGPQPTQPVPPQPDQAVPQPTQPVPPQPDQAVPQPPQPVQQTQVKNGPPPKTKHSPKIACSDYLLDDNDINACLHLIHKQWPEVSVQDVLLIQTSFKKADGKFCQVLHDDAAKHWLAVSNIGSKDGNARVMDSLSISLKPKIINAISCECNLTT